MWCLPWRLDRPRSRHRRRWRSPRPSRQGSARLWSSPGARLIIRKRTDFKEGLSRHWPQLFLAGRHGGLETSLPAENGQNILLRPTWLPNPTEDWPEAGWRWCASGGLARMGRTHPLPPGRSAPYTVNLSTDLPFVKWYLFDVVQNQSWHLLVRLMELEKEGANAASTYWSPRGSRRRCRQTCRWGKPPRRRWRPLLWQILISCQWSWRWRQ